MRTRPRASSALMAMLAALLLARGRRALASPAPSPLAAAAASAARAFSVSTESRYSASEGGEAVFTGPYRFTRASLDYAYHLNYVPSRQAVQDAIVARFLAGGARVAPPVVHLSVPAVPDGSSAAAGAGEGEGMGEGASAGTSAGASAGVGAGTGAGAGVGVGTGAGAGMGASSARGTGPWLVYTAGAMGAGKSHTLRFLHAQGLFPLDRFIWVDPDAIKGLLPDMRGYLAHNRSQAGTLTHKESGFIAEIVTLEAMRSSKCLVVDGTLRDRDWYSRWFGRVRSEFPHYRIAILMITAPRERIYERAQRRGAVTSRVVSRATLDEAIDQVPVSFSALAPLADFTATFFNDEDNEAGPRLQPPHTREAFSATWDDVRAAPAPDASPLSRRMIGAEVALADMEEPQPNVVAAV